ncbi:MAG: amidohydrolase family protein [Gammaproteobacteria bacterium]|jgi:imidazolonepropionase-like amidohydrolase|nr:amidohydrolase family protein [Gammaproteobacteria bacterium]
MKFSIVNNVITFRSLFMSVTLVVWSGLALCQGEIVLKGATLIDGTGAPPLKNSIIVIDGDRFKRIGSTSKHINISKNARVIDVSGKYIVPGLMDANVHLFRDVSIEFIARYEDRLEELITEGAQIALKHGLTTVFDSWGPLQPLMNVRDRINRGEIPGSRVYVAGNIVGLSGPFGRDFNAVGSWIAPKTFVNRINAIFEENTGPQLSLLSPNELRGEIRKYVNRDIDFLKYAVNGHDCRGCSGFPELLNLSSVLLFTPEAQDVIVDETHKGNITVQTHTSSVVALQQAVNARVDMMQHCAMTGEIPIPDALINQMLETKIFCAVQPRTSKRMKAESENSNLFRRTPKMQNVWHENQIRLMKAGVPLLLATDAGVANPIKTEVEVDQKEFDVEHPEMLGEAHFIWFRAMSQKGMKPMQSIVSATRNIAAAYGKLQDLGTVEKNKLADLVILNKNPLDNIENMRSISMVIKNGEIVDREALPINPILTK